MKELCSDLGWIYDVIPNYKESKLYIGINQLIYNKGGFPDDCNVIWEVTLNYKHIGPWLI